MLGATWVMLALNFLFFTSCVSSIGNTELHIFSNVNVMIRVLFCVNYNCGNPIWEDIPPYEVMANETFIYEHRFLYPTLLKSYLILNIRDGKDEETFIEEEEANFYLRREFSNFTLSPYRNAIIEFAVRNVCDENFFKDSCSTFCKPNPANHIICHKDVGEVCVHGWKGLRCEKPHCDRSCNFVGSCVEPNKCNCTEGWRGDQCEECIPSSTCKNGKCAKRKNGYFEIFSCDCDPGFFGRNCDKADLCYFAKPCRYGTCELDKNTESGFKCSCFDGYQGNRCENQRKASTCSLGKPCLNNGTCVQVAERHRCKCRVGFFGRLCEFSSNPDVKNATNDCSVTICTTGNVCIMDGESPICVSSTVPGPFVTYKETKRGITYQIFYGQFYWKTKTAKLNFNEIVGRAVNVSTVNVYYVQPPQDDSLTENDDFEVEQVEEKSEESTTTALPKRVGSV